MTMTRDQFFATLAPYAVRLRREGSPLFPSVRLAQNLLETGGVIHPWNNLGGIKVGAGEPNEWWDGAAVNKSTWEVYNGIRVATSADFRAYASIYHFYKDQDRLLGHSRYARVREAKSPESQAIMLRACGYATDPNYASKLVAIIRQYGLTKYDRMTAEEEGERVELSTYQWNTLVEALERLVERGTINDPAWVDKAKSRTLTASELAWVTFVIASR